MSAVWTVAAREMRARRMVMVAAVVVGVLLSLTFVALLRAGATPPDQALIGLLFGTAFPVAIALGVGASMFSGEMSERRLGFYFSRPIPALHLWAGKVLGASVVVVIAFASIQASFLFAEMGFAGYFRILSVAGPLLLFVMAVGHVMTSMYRARSPWFAADIVLAVASVAAFVSIVRVIVEAGAFLSSLRFGPILPALLAATVVALLGGAAAQLVVGRTDARRGHLALSVTVWASIFVVLGGFAMWQRWLLGGTPAQAGGAGYPLVVSPAGEGIFFRGLTGRAGFMPFYLMDAGTGAFLRISPDAEPLPTFSPDGRTAAWVSIPEPWEADHRRRLWVVRLGEGVRLVARAPLEGSARWNTVLAVHPDGRQAVIGGFESVGLVDLDTAEVSVSVPQARVTAADVLADGRIRLFSTTPERTGGTVLSMAVWSPGEDAVIEKLRVPHAALLTRQADLAVLATGPREKAIVDLATGAVRRVTAPMTDTMPRALVLADGRLALGMGTEVRIMDAAGATVSVVSLPGKSQVDALRELEPGQIAVGAWSVVLRNRRTLFVDAATGTVRHEEPGFQAAGSTPGAQPAPGSLASRLFTDADGNLLALEPGYRRRVIVSAIDGGR